jgi:hypothetical protein
MKASTYEEVTTMIFVMQVSCRERCGRRLLEEREKAPENGERYALETACNAMAVKRRLGYSPAPVP